MPTEPTLAATHPGIDAGRAVAAVIANANANEDDTFTRLSCADTDQIITFLAAFAPHSFQDAETFLRNHMNNHPGYGEHDGHAALYAAFDDEPTVPHALPADEAVTEYVNNLT